ncbi:uncharacterized protein BT62DRAFT_357377 [Guyanagaster necrorhizus]|uniref:Uncharacterized protein n=1 Tax=Guyanagaster necrorhizus TaxID=856835 RepID=A0A9P7VNN8_9AGAR|nr:uncharacterized protein BT62DRAFT_357377 [Guyanagaster necrorhizus MCA 3950]KAG7443174.1 hypothetical protein BT62DRAFT_357377 [Guyanagaster necrorhizus MCA 3950]
MDLSTRQLTEETLPFSRRPTTPIEIPSRQKQALSPHLSPIQDQISPELLFEMSPLISNLSPSANYMLRPSSVHNHQDPEPYLYHFPVFSPHRFKSMHPSPSPTPSGSTSTRTSKFTSETTSKPDSWPKPPTFIPGDSENQPSPVVKASATYKITGFSPVFPSPVSELSSRRRLERLSPPPRLSSSGCIPGPRDAILDNPDALHSSSPGALDFDKFLIRRITNMRRPLLLRPTSSNLRAPLRH